MRVWKVVLLGRKSHLCMCTWQIRVDHHFGIENTFLLLLGCLHLLAFSSPFLIAIHSSTISNTSHSASTACMAFGIPRHLSLPAESQWMFPSLCEYGIVGTMEGCLFPLCIRSCLLHHFIPFLVSLDRLISSVFIYHPVYPYSPYLFNNKPFIRQKFSRLLPPRMTHCQVWLFIGWSQRSSKMVIVILNVE